VCRVHTAAGQMLVVWPRRLNTKREQQHQQQRHSNSPTPAVALVRTDGSKSVGLPRERDR